MLAKSCITASRQWLNVKHCFVKKVQNDFPRNYASLLERERKIAEREENVYQFAALGSKRPNYVHVWGNATTGALGRLRY